MKIDKTDVTRTMYIKKLIIGDNYVIFKEPLELKPYFIKENLCIANEDYSLYLCCSNRSELFKETKRYLKFLYKEYVINNKNDTLPDAAKKLKQKFIENTYEIQGDS